MPPKKNVKGGGSGRRAPVKLADFLRADFELSELSLRPSKITSRSSNISPVLSATSSATTTAKPKSVWSVAANKPNLIKNQGPFNDDEEFPTMGTIRRKKPKNTRAALPATPTLSAATLSAPSSPLPPSPPPPSLPSAAGGGGGAQGSGRVLLSTDNCFNKQEVITKWLNSVQQPIGQSQLLQTPMPQSVPSMSAPAAIASKQQQLSQKSQGNNKPQKQQTTTNVPSGQYVTLSMPITRTRTMADVALDNEENQQWRRIDFNPNTNRSEAAYIDQSPICHYPNSIITGRCNERRLQADQMLQMSGRQAYPCQQQTQPLVPNEMLLSTSRTDNCNPLQQSNNAPLSSSQSQSQSQSQLFDIASRSTLNSNAIEFFPSQRAALPNERRPMISERRRRQRFHRTLKPNTVFQLPTYELQMSQSAATNWQPQPTYDISPNNNRNSTAINNSQSVFGRGSLRRYVGTHTEDLSTISDPPYSSVSRSLLNMDTQEFQPDTSMFFEPDNNPNTTSSTNESVHLDAVHLEKAIKLDNKSDPALPRHRIFVAGGSRPGVNGSVTVDMNFMPPSIKQLHSLICSKYSDYTFVYTLSSQLSQHSVPIECFVYLKMALLGSLASIEQDELRPPISLCVICSDSSVAHRLMNSIGQLSPRFIGPHEGGQQPAFTALPTRHNWAVASPLLLAQQGVYFVGDWNRLTRDQSEEIEKCIENGTVPVARLQNEQPLEAAIWTYWQPENAANQTTAFAKLCPIFGLPIYMDEQVNDEIWDFVLRLHSEDGLHTTPDAFSIPDEDMRTMLGLLHQRQVSFTKPAQRLLQKYYVVSRIEQPTAFSSKTYVVLKQFAESIAKLSMRLEVLETDVIVAIFHCEHFVRNIFGAGDYPPPAVASFSVISRVDPYMSEFAKWLFEYLDRYRDDMNSDGK